MAAMGEMNTALGFDMMDKLLPDVAEIFADDEVKALKAQVSKDGKVAVGVSLAPVMALFLGKHRQAMLRMAATLAGCSVEEINAQPLEKTIELLQSGVNDQLLAFFAVCLRMVMTA